MALTVPLSWILSTDHSACHDLGPLVVRQAGSSAEGQGQGKEAGQGWCSLSEPHWVQAD